MTPGFKPSSSVTPMSLIFSMLLDTIEEYTFGLAVFKAMKRDVLRKREVQEMFDFGRDDREITGN
jgi:hypothetical protein